MTPQPHVDWGQGDVSILFASLMVSGMAPYARKQLGFGMVVLVVVGWGL